jgi:phosphate-selective porin OprO/OprP
LVRQISSCTLRHVFLANLDWMILRKYLLILWVCLSAGLGTVKAQDEDTKVEVSYGGKGFEFKTTDDKFSLQIQSRLQFRYATPSDQNPVTFNDYNPDQTHIFKINRARLKIGGNAYKPWLKYYWEYDVASSRLLDFRLMIEKWEWMSFKVGQWKIYYTRERVISSGKQQMVDRSILNRPFTVDRQQGVSVYGRVLKGTQADFTYHLSAVTGTGRGVSFNDDEHLMYVGRLQWNLFGRELPMTASDIEGHEKFTGSVAFAAVANTSPYTRFSSSGGGQLEGFESGEAGQYTSDQFLIETAFMYKGLSWQQEYHQKQIWDNLNNTYTRLTGNLVQAGYFFHHMVDWFPEPLEIAARYAYYIPDDVMDNNLEEEFGIAANWFFNGHKNKLTAEFTFFEAQQPSVTIADGGRFRVQWDISF